MHDQERSRGGEEQEPQQVIEELVRAAITKRLTPENYQQIVEGKFSDEELRKLLVDTLQSEQGYALDLTDKNQETQHFSIRYVESKTKMGTPKKEILFFARGGSEPIAHSTVTVAQANNIHGLDRGTDEEYRGMGIARLGFSLLSEVLISQGVAEVHMEIAHDNESSRKSHENAQRIIGGGTLELEKLQPLEDVGYDMYDDYVVKLIPDAT